jgi:uroporphyrin-3 C-methyltransferase
MISNVSDSNPTPSETPVPTGAEPAITALGHRANALPAWLPWAALALAVLVLVALGLSWQSLSRSQALEQELVRRQESSQDDAQEARTMAKQSQELTRETAAKTALLEARLAEVALQRSQLEELIQSMSRSRDENVVVDIEASLRVALQQTSITGSAEPLVAALKQADERLARYKQPRMEGVRRAVARDLDRVRAVSVVDISTLTIKLDEVVRLVDELPLMSSADKSSDLAQARQARSEKPGSASKLPPMPSITEDWSGWWAGAQLRWSGVARDVWAEARSLLRVTRIEHPEAMLLAPDQAYFLRENLKLRLLNARLALLSRQFDTAQTDLRDTLTMLDRYFDTRSRKVTVANELLRQVTGQARQVVVPRPDDTLSALAATAAGR